MLVAALNRGGRGGDGVAEGTDQHTVKAAVFSFQLPERNNGSVPPRVVQVTRRLVQVGRVVPGVGNVVREPGPVVSV